MTKEKSCVNCGEACCGILNQMRWNRSDCFMFSCSNYTQKKEKKIYKADVWVIWNDQIKCVVAQVVERDNFALHSYCRLIKKIPIECEYEET